ncbi:MAG TPA: tetratricopeptide repeat protein [Geminicoccaceae bacterium]|nr:tetratricopeptide repeat protein [Geminicoccaceae bacterium]
MADPYEDGKRNLAAGRYEVAIERFGQALANDRTSLDALNGLAIAYAGLGRFEIALPYFERALQVDATNAVTLNNYGWSLIEQGRLRDAKPFLELALRHAAEADAPVVATNLESIGRARPSALLATLEKGSPAEAGSGHRIIRVAADVYRLEAADGPPRHADAEMALRQQPAAEVSTEQAQTLPDPTSDPVVVAEDIGARQLGDARIEIRPEPMPEPGAGAILPGEKT